jgi:hypothetical protein
MTEQSKVYWAPDYFDLIPDMDDDSCMDDDVRQAMRRGSNAYLLNEFGAVTEERRLELEKFLAEIDPESAEAIPKYAKIAFGHLHTAHMIGGIEKFVVYMLARKIAPSPKTRKRKAPQGQAPDYIRRRARRRLFNLTQS